MLKEIKEARKNFFAENNEIYLHIDKLNEELRVKLASQYIERRDRAAKENSRTKESVR